VTATKTNACRILDDAGVAYELRSYDVDEDDLSAESVAAKVGLPPEQVWKTLCVRGDKTGPLFAVLAGNEELDLKACARASGNKSVEPVPLKELTGLTGYIRGGVTVLAAKKALPVVVDEMIEAHDVVSVSAGQRGLQIVLAPADYLRVTKAITAPIARAKT
jgi:Cys-tRNA(Pro)/Cys-tRNA(Cys) deacylase